MFELEIEKRNKIEIEKERKTKPKPISKQPQTSRPISISFFPFSPKKTQQTPQPSQAQPAQPARPTSSTHARPGLLRFGPHRATRSARTARPRHAARPAARARLRSRPGPPARAASRSPLPLIACHRPSPISPRPSHPALSPAPPLVQQPLARAARRPPRARTPAPATATHSPSR